MIILILLSYQMKSQEPSKNEISINCSVYLNNQKIETDSVLVTFNRIENNHSYSRITNDFTTFIGPNKVYKMIITHPGYNRYIINIVTVNELKTINIRVNLTKNKNDKIVYYTYSNKVKDYVRNE